MLKADQETYWEACFEYSLLLFRPLNKNQVCGEGDFKRTMAQEYQAKLPPWDVFLAETALWELQLAPNTQMGLHGHL